MVKDQGALFLPRDNNRPCEREPSEMIGVCGKV